MGFSWGDCHLTQPNQDYDLLNDDCEHQLAFAFRPKLVFHRLEYAMSREEYWAADVSLDYPEPEVRIFYLLALHRDTGLVSHNGDSEFLELIVRSVGQGYWAVENILMSAHWQAMFGADWTTRYGYGSLSYYDAYRGRPYVFVSRDHHANYNSEGRCESHLLDYCSSPSNGQLESVRVYADRNLGSDFRPPWAPDFPAGRFVDCVSSTQGYPGVECFWMNWPGIDETFAGWQGSGGTTPYYQPLGFYGWLWGL